MDSRPVGVLPFRQCSKTPTPQPIRLITVTPPRTDRPGKGLDTSLVRPLGLIGKTQTQPVGAVAGGLLDTAPKTRCPNTYGLFIVSVERGVAYPLTCSRWDCPNPGCGGLKRMAAREVFTGGYELARGRGERVRLITFTSLPGTTGPGFSAGLNRTLTRLRSKGLLAEYAGAVERTESGLPHAHLLTTGAYIEQDELSRIAYGGPTCSTRLGEVTDIRAVRGDGSRSALTRYLLKQQTAEGLAAYVSKAATEQARAVRAIEGATYHRPIRLSRGFYPGGMGAATKAVKARWSDGAEPVTATDWQVLRRDESGRVSVLTRPKAARPPIDVSGYRVVTDSGSAVLRAA